MTFKHVKFQDSAVMRSLEKVAREKGLVKEDELVKTASAPDLEPTANLTVNLLKLSEGLRAKGFEKAAVELENKVIAYKQAQTLYETSKEKGEDLVDAAHPKGSHKLEDVDGDDLAVFETIIDQHLKSVELAGKKPNGKLASNDEVVDAVRLVLGDSFLGNGRKVAQETPAPSSDAGSMVGGAALSVGATYGISKLWQAVLSKMKPTLQQQVIKDVETRLGGKLSKEMAKKVSEKVVNEAVEEAVKKRLGQKATEAAVQQAEKQIASKVVPELGQAGLNAAQRAAAQKGTEQVAKTVATEGATAVAKSPGTWGRLVSYLRMPVAGTGAAGAGTAGTGAAVEGAAVAGAEGAAATAGVGVGAAAAAALASFVVAAGATYLVTSAIYNSKFYSTELKEAGDKLLSELKDVQSVPGWQSNAGKEMEFKRSLAICLASAETVKGFISNPTPDGLIALKDYASNLQEASNYAYSLSSAARTLFDGDGDMKPGESRETGGMLSGLWDNIRTAPIARGLGADAPQLGDVIITGAEFSNLAQKAIGEVNFAINKIVEMADKEAARRTASAGGAEVQNLNKSYTDAVAKIGEYVQKVKAKQLPNAQALLAWLAKAEKAVNSESEKFKAVPEVNKPAVAKDYTQRFDKLNAKIKAFADKWMA